MNFTPESKVLIQGITEPIGATYAALMKNYGTNVIAGISPGRGGEQVEEIEIFDMVEQAVGHLGAIDTSVIFVPPYDVLDAALEAMAAGIRQIIIVTEGMPPLDMVHLVRQAEATETLIVGPNTPGIIVPGKILLGTHKSDFYTPGSVGLLSRSGTLTYEIAWQLTQAKLGQSIAIGIGSDAIVGSSFAQWLQILDEDEATEAIVLVGEIGGSSEETAAHYIAEAIDKPTIAYVAGRHAPKGKRLGHAGDIMAAQLSVGRTHQVSPVGADPDTAQSKIAAFKAANIPVAQSPSEIPDLVKKALKPSRKKK
ncbi:succinate--CoA ligase subunit alpha [Oxynema aestuarii]|jgi:succinyl-CoA synthetase alpha subunit|uniref:CoA-binding protein n=1 Tax=Oxynema aestuarii AP17 TaxID=2064643 RepID=A0A6H1U1J5_9CYAN|nr:CoA-binding protein [Oxynema aestuarii]QIZ72040.1 CoA-binding protein [Oxynema aestuarii AP17]RMH76311.1 MAG: CoA-binding protein [Cyanobacteria bacterium J007]